MQLSLCIFFLAGAYATQQPEIDGVCGAGDACSNPSRSLLQLSNSIPSERSGKPTMALVAEDGPMGSNAPLNEAGYQSVAALCCSTEMQAFIMRIIKNENLKICAMGGVAGLVVWYDCVDDGSSYSALFAAIQKGDTGDCPFLSRTDVCLGMNGACPNIPEATYPPCGPGTTPAPPGTTIAPGGTTTAPTGTTTAPGCQGPAKDIFLAIDASKSVEQSGWTAEIDFSVGLVQAITKDGNGVGHRINAHWFNDVTALVDGNEATGTKGPGEVHANKGNNGGWASNDIGKFSTNGGKIVSALKSLDYPTIRDGSTDHPQVYLTAQAAFQANPGSAEKIIVLVTDGETHNGEDCPGKNDVAVVEKVVGSCSNNANHVCRRSNGQKTCDMSKCMCGLYKSELIKKLGYRLIIVAIPNMNWADSTTGFTQATFEKQMAQMASPNSLYFATSFSALNSIVKQLESDLCK